MVEDGGCLSTTAVEAADSVLDLIRLDEMKPCKTVVVQLAAELLGTFLLVVVGCGSTTTAWSEGYQPTTVQVALTFGLTVACIVQTLGYVSGAHVNPAVTVGLVVGGFLGPLKALLYVTAQCVGATAGSLVLQALTPNETVATLGVNALNRHVTPTQGCFVEMVISFMLVMAVYSAATGAAAGPFTVGMSVTACHLFAVYWVGPCVGGVAAGIVYQYFRREEPVDASESRASPGQASGMASGIAERNV
ncbi:aquaporin AQPcic-like [Schistocerca serialis cubense]|uniref:aquaporin AQPcic-like n=1 Tax=Schistocerca serialis cubense TaxID=2023355 RepID=UPI00214E6343|nr:aquaporin AQPcic-like [Schistocerca serialis cubense]